MRLNLALPLCAIFLNPDDHDAFKFNPDNQAENQNPFVANHPDRLSHVEVSDA